MTGGIIGGNTTDFLLWTAETYAVLQCHLLDELSNVLSASTAQTDRFDESSGVHFWEIKASFVLILIRASLKQKV